MKYNFSVVIFFLLILSCMDGRNKQIEKLVKEWNNKIIRFPQHPVFTRTVTDTVHYQIPESGYKVVVFVDSVGCISCKLQLPKWKELMDEVDSLIDDNVSFIFFFQSNDIKDLKYIMEHSRFTHPVCIDTEDRFNSLNHFPADMAFHTFLLDADNKVVAIGNPVHNPKVKELYLRIIRGEADGVRPEKETAVTSVEVDNRKMDMGSFLSVYCNAKPSLLKLHISGVAEK